MILVMILFGIDVYCICITVMYSFIHVKENADLARDREATG